MSYRAAKLRLFSEFTAIIGFFFASEGAEPSVLCGIDVDSIGCSSIRCWHVFHSMLAYVSDFTGRLLRLYWHVSASLQGLNRLPTTVSRPVDSSQQICWRQSTNLLTPCQQPHNKAQKCRSNWRMRCPRRKRFSSSSMDSDPKTGMEYNFICISYNLRHWASPCSLAAS